MTPEYLLTATSLSPCFFAVESNPFLGGGSPRGESERRGRFLQHERHKHKKQENTARHRHRRCCVSLLSRGNTHRGNSRVSLLKPHDCCTKKKKTRKSSLVHILGYCTRSFNKDYEGYTLIIEKGRRRKKTLKNEYCKRRRIVAMRGKGGRRGTAARRTGIRGREE